MPPVRLARPAQPAFPIRMDLDPNLRKARVHVDCFQESLAEQNQVGFVDWLLSKWQLVLELT
jgi:hypothetical protein